ncbi:hypothetical protein FKM82_007287 [Ascaphus truei]
MDGQTYCQLNVAVLLCIVTLTTTDGLPISRTAWRPRQAASIAGVIDAYYTGGNSDFIFRVLKDSYGAETADESKLKFMIRETVCPKSAQQNIEQCAFKENGLVKSCTATSDGSKKRTIVVDCDTVTAGSNVLKDNLEGENEKEKSPNKIESQLKKRHVNTLSRNKKAIGSNSTMESHAMASCIWCIFDILRPKTQIAKK